MIKLLPYKLNKKMRNFAIAVFFLTGLTAIAQCPTAPGNQQSYGQGQWTGYVYSDNASFTAPPASASAFTYRGYITQPEAFDLNWGGNAVSGTNVCGSYADYYTVRFKMNKTYAAGYYAITVGADDGYRFSLDGGATWNTSLSDWTTHGYTYKTANVYLNGSTNFVYEYFEYEGGARVSFAIKALPCASTAPTAVSGTTSLDCNTPTTTLTASGGTVGYASTYQWGTGNTVGQNIISGQTGASLITSPYATTTYWVRRANGNPCGGFSDAIFKTVTVTGSVGNPSQFGQGVWNTYAFTGANLDVSNLVYNGYYTQNTLGFDSTTAWGSDYSPSYAANYQGCAVGVDNFTFVTKRKGFPCGRYTVAMTRWDDDAVVYVNGTQVWSKTGWSGGLTNNVVGVYDLDANSTIEVRVREAGGGANGALSLTPTSAPTGISGNLSLGCGVTSTTLTATGGHAAGATVYQWGTGSVAGQNVIEGQTSASIVVSPKANTTYWVRLANVNNCGTMYSSAVTTTVIVNIPPGNPAVFGENQWNAYAYTGTNINMSGASYYGFYTQNTLGIDTTTGTNSWSKELSPSAASGYQGCAVPNDNFILVYKRKGFECGNYQMNYTRWDDDFELYIDGVKVYSKTGWSGDTAVNDNAGTYVLGENTQVELRLRETAGTSHLTMLLTRLTTLSTAPTGITGPSASQCGGNVTLNATGGTLGTNAVYQWGTGAVGSNVIANATTATITVAPQTTTTYWVRIKTMCNTFTSAVTYNVTANATVAGTLSTTSTTACKNSLPAAITLSGYNGAVVKWQSANDAAFTQGVTDIANTAAVLAPAQMGIVTASKYYRAVVQNNGCNQLTTAPLQISVPAPVVWNGSWSSTPGIDTAVEIQSDLTVDANLTVCSCQVKNNAVLTVNSNVNLTVKGKVTVDATAKMIVSNNASLLQIDDVANEGNVEIHRSSSKVKRFDYTIWSSPVSNQQLLAFSPATLTDRFFIYNTSNNYYSRIKPDENNFELAKGYLIRTPNNHATVATVFAGTFSGTPHNGTVTRPLEFYGTGKGFNAIGNPYASPISVSAFIDANIDNIEGTIWFWRKTNDSSQSSYCVLTKFAYVANSAPGGANEFAIDPNGHLNTGQGFIVKAKNEGNVIFTNAMREGNSSNQFLKTAQPQDVSKYRLNITDVNGSFSQAVIGYTPEATLDYDNGLDGKSFVDNNINLYSVQDVNRLAIQARPEFSITDTVPMGFKATQAGAFSISLAEADGVFAAATQPVFVWDTQEGIIFNLKNAAYTFTTEAGTFNERFVMIYSAQALGTDNPELTANNVVVYGTEGQLNVKSTEPIKSVAAYDILGRQLLNKVNVKSDTFSAGVTAAQQVIVVKVVLESGKATEKKIILK